MSSHIDTILDALTCYQSDSAARARLAFRGKSEAEMQKEYGQSGETCNAILFGYEQRERRVQAAIDWVKTLDNPPRADGEKNEN